MTFYTTSPIPLKSHFLKAFSLEKQCLLALHKLLIPNLGKVYDSKIKGMARMLLSKYGDNFSSDYYANKDFLRRTVRFRSKKLLNRVAGYITSVKSSAKQQEEVVEVAEE
jgi:small subunit ribosomal protein S17e